MNPIENNFSWIVRGIIAGSAFPSTELFVNQLELQGVKVIVNLTENSHYPKDLKLEDRFILHRIRIKDFEAPTLNQIVEFQDLIIKYKSKSFPVLVHCLAGCGRTGTILASYLLNDYPKQDLDSVISEIRSRRPCSIETQSQEEVLAKYKDYLLLNRDR